MTCLVAERCIGLARASCRRRLQGLWDEDADWAPDGRNATHGRISKKCVVAFCHHFLFLKSDNFARGSIVIYCATGTRVLATTKPKFRWKFLYRIGGNEECVVIAFLTGLAVQSHFWEIFTFWKVYFNRPNFQIPSIFPNFLQILRGSFSVVQVTARVPKRAPLTCPHVVYPAAITGGRTVLPFPSNYR